MASVFPLRLPYPHAVALPLLVALACTSACGDDVTSNPSGDSTGASSTGLPPADSTTGPDETTTTTPGTSSSDGPGTTTTGIDSSGTTTGDGTSSGTTGDTTDSGTTDTGEESTDSGTTDTGEESTDSGTTDTGEESTDSGTTDTGGSICGDDVIDPGELCDGIDLDGEDCITQGFIGGALGCGPDCTFDTTGCFDPICGDGIIDGEEACDTLDLDEQDCITQGFDAGDLGCSDDCTFDTSQCQLFTCGDDVVDAGEACDGVDLAGQDCTTLGFTAGTLACALNCAQFDTTACTDVCGDGFVGASEGCEPGVADGQTCATAGFIDGELSCNPDCTLNTTACYDEQLTVCGTPGSAIGPDGGTTTTELLALPSTGGALLDVDVSVALSHSFMGDLDVAVRYVPSDTAVQLFEHACGEDDDLSATFDQEAAAPIACGSPVGGGLTVLPFEDLSTLYNHGDGSGAWELTVFDNFFGDGGSVDEWCVTLRTSSSAPLCGDSQIEGAESCDNNELGGTRCEDLGFGGGALDCGPTCGFDTSACSNEVIAACSAPGLFVGFDSPTITDTLSLIDPGAIEDIDVFVASSHTWIGDLDISLTHDDTGTTIDLLADECDEDPALDMFVVLDDEGGPLPADCIEPRAVEGRLAPLNPLAGFDGEDLAGDWTLTVTDDAPDFDDGTLDEWCIYITVAAP